MIMQKTHRPRRADASDQDKSMCSLEDLQHPGQVSSMLGQESASLSLALSMGCSL